MLIIPAIDIYQGKCVRLFQGDFKKKTIFLGIAYSFQKCRKIPVNKHDFKLDYIFTERGIISSNQ